MACHLVPAVCIGTVSASLPPPAVVTSAGYFTVSQCTVTNRQHLPPHRCCCQRGQIANDVNVQGAASERDPDRGHHCTDLTFTSTDIFLNIHRRETLQLLGLLVIYSQKEYNRRITEGICTPKRRQILHLFLIKTAFVICFVKQIFNFVLD